MCRGHQVRSSCLRKWTWGGARQLPSLPWGYGVSPTCLFPCPCHTLTCSHRTVNAPCEASITFYWLLRRIITFVREVYHSGLIFSITIFTGKFCISSGWCCLQIQSFCPYVCPSFLSKPVLLPVVGKGSRRASQAPGSLRALKCSFYASAKVSAVCRGVIGRCRMSSPIYLCQMVLKY